MKAPPDIEHPMHDFVFGDKVRFKPSFISPLAPTPLARGIGTIHHPLTGFEERALGLVRIIWTSGDDTIEMAMYLEHVDLPRSVSRPIAEVPHVGEDPSTMTLAQLDQLCWAHELISIYWGRYTDENGDPKLRLKGPDWGVNATTFTELAQHLRKMGKL